MSNLIDRLEEQVDKNSEILESLSGLKSDLAQWIEKLKRSDAGSELGLSDRDIGLKENEDGADLVLWFSGPGSDLLSLRSRLKETVSQNREELQDIARNNGYTMDTIARGRLGFFKE